RKNQEMNCLPASDMAWAEGVLSILSFWIIVVKSWERASVGLGKRDGIRQEFDCLFQKKHC
ncbi:hypothetical protein HID58_060604, partial [Brassica napus]